MVAHSQLKSDSALDLELKNPESNKCIRYSGYFQGKRIVA